MTHTSRHILLGAIAIITIAVVGCGSGSGDSSGMLSISGTIAVPGSTAIDSDVNDINTIPKSNDTFDAHQALDKNPVILGGYVNAPFQGEDGNSYQQGDAADVFKIALTKNETVNLYIAEYGVGYPGEPRRDMADIDLYLYDQEKILVEASVGDRAIEQVRTDSAGTYFIRVAAVSGASNYILTVGQGITGATLMGERLAADFMPGHIVVRFRPEVADARMSRSLTTGFMGLRRHSGIFQGETVLKIDADNRRQVFRALGIESAENNRRLYAADDPALQLKLDTLRTVDALRKHPDVMLAEPNYLRHPMGEPDDEHYPLQWHYPLIHLPQAWEITTGSQDVIVAVIDTGILTGHPDIDPTRLVDGYDFISDPAISLDGDGIDNDPADPGDEMEGGSSFHGTHVAGTIGAATNNQIGVAGIARGCKIMPLRVLGNGGGLANDIRQAIYYAAGLDNSSGKKPARRADIINLSLGGTSPSTLDQEAIDAARGAGVIIIAAAGNHASSTPLYPAAYEGVVSVSAVGADKQLAPYSGFGNSVDIAAPGGNMSRDYDGDGHLDGVLSTSGDDTVAPTRSVYHFSQGTSMAAPHVAGVAALMKSIKPELTPDMLDRHITGDLPDLPPITEDLGPGGRDDSFGYGLIDAFKAVKAVKEDLPTFLFVTPLELNFGTALDSLTLTAENFGADPLTVQPPVISDAEALWLTIDNAFDDEKQAGTYTVEVNRNGLPDGPYAAAIILESSVNTVEISINMQKGVPTGGDAGFHYVVLLDPNTFETVVQSDVAAPVNGVYPFSLQAKAGEYILFAGTDSDNDYAIGDSGESAGAYNSLDQPSVIHLTRDRRDINFVTSFNLNLPTTLSGHREGNVSHVQQDTGFRINKPLAPAAQAAP